MRYLAIGAAIPVFALLLAGFLGFLHPAGDSLALLRLPLTALAAIAVLVLRRPRRLRAGGAALTGLSVASLAIAHCPGAPGPITVYQRNLWFANPDLAAIAAEIRHRDPDIVLLQEVSDHTVGLLDTLRADWPAQTFCRFSGWSGIAVLSRHPMIAGSAQCSDWRGLAAMQIALGGRPVWVGSVHLFWPWPHDQAKQRAKPVARIDRMEGPVILGGDFNMVPWSHGVRALARAAGGSVARPALSTRPVRGMPLPIDHVIAPGGGSATRLPRQGSDHFGLLARVHLAQR
ncbi:MAG: endonuclease/exonuclease/phosphatase family protein [Rhodobacteraceae bacterium]|jgi:endonuclease/exonuclease/phosphatase (EEP) superfamily protein YafD|nr:endonuclease/exonuclease/phosphatase family protein [Paracoccaceae bacterium]